MKTKPKIDTAIKLATEVKTSVPEVISLSIDKIGAKNVTRVVKELCLRTALEKCQFPVRLLATSNDEEQAEVASALFYLFENWEKCSKEGMRIIESKVKKAQEKIANKMSDLHKECGNCYAQHDPNVPCGKCKNHSLWKHEGVNHDT